MQPLDRRIGRWITRLKWQAIALAFVALVAADYAGPAVMQIVDQRAGDILLSLDARRRPVSDRVVIVDVDQRSLEAMNDLAGSWPWPRSVHGELIEAIAAQQPRAIAFDVLFNELDSYRPEHDAAFADAAARYPNVWQAMALASDGIGARVGDMPPSVGAVALDRPANPDARVPLFLPLALLSRPEAMRGGLINFTEDTDSVGRRYALHLDQAGWRFPSLPARILAAEGRKLPPAASIMLNWRRGWTHLPYADLYLDSLREKKLRPADELKGKIVVIGTSAPGLMDLRLTPLGSTYPGVEILATAIDNLDRGDWLREVPRGATVPLALAIIAAISFGLKRGIGAERLGYGMLVLTAVVLAAAYAALAAGWFVPVYAPLAFGWGFYVIAGGIAYLQERAGRLRTSGMFKRFLDPRVVSQLIESGDLDYRNTAEAREVSVLFSDIRGFTALSETTRPEDVVALLNGYFSRQVEVIFRHSGTLDKFIGDAIMAFWGAPAAMPDHAARAVAAALDMSAALEDLRGQLGALGAELEIGIGINSGRAVSGFIGSSDRLDYTVIGDTVNLASRVEGLTKGIARILVSEATMQAAGDAFEWIDQGLHSVKGREMQVRLFEPRRKQV